MDDEIFEVMMASMSEEDNYALLLSNPTRISGFFYNIFRKFSDLFTCLMFDGYDSLRDRKYYYNYYMPNGDLTVVETPGMLTARYIKNLIVLYGEESDIFRKRVRARWPKSETENVINPDHIRRVKNRDRPSQIYDPTTPRILGCDPGGSGDATGIFGISGANIVYTEELYGKTPTEIGRYLEEMYRQSCATPYPWTDFVIDANGLGAGTASYLLECTNVKCNVYGVVTHEIPPIADVRADRIRDFLAWCLAEWFRNEFVYVLDMNPACEKFFEEATSILKVLDHPQGKYAIERKKDYRKREKSSPNLFDAACLCMFPRYDLLMMDNPQENKKERTILDRYKNRNLEDKKDWMLV